MDLRLYFAVAFQQQKPVNKCWTGCINHRESIQWNITSIKNADLYWHAVLLSLKKKSRETLLQRSPFEYVNAYLL